MQAAIERAQMHEVRISEHLEALARKARAQAVTVRGEGVLSPSDPHAFGLKIAAPIAPTQIVHGSVVVGEPAIVIPPECREAYEVYKRIIAENAAKATSAAASDPDGPLVPLPAKPEPVREVPPLLLSTYQTMLRY